MNAAVNRDLKNIMSKLQEIIQSQRELSNSSDISSSQNILDSKKE